MARAGCAPEYHSGLQAQVRVMANHSSGEL